MSGDDLEPIDLEPADLDRPDSRRDVADDARLRPGRDRRRVLAVGALGLGVVACAALALTAKGGHRGATPAPAPSSTTSPGGLVDPVARVGGTLRSALRRTGSGRFAIVVDDHLYVLGGARTTPALVLLPDGPVTIEDASGSSLLTSSSATTLVSTDNLFTRTLTDHETALRATTPEHWWILRDDGTIRADFAGAPTTEPAGLRLTAAVRNGFVALDAHSAWVAWVGTSITPLPAPAGQLVASAPDAVVLRNDCSLAGCVLAFNDLADSTSTSIRFPAVPEFAAYSPDGTRLAVASTVGDVFILDASTGRILDRTLSRQSDSPSLPFSWTPKGDALLVVQDEDVEVRRASDGALTRVIPGTAGLEQLVALP